MVLKPVGMGVEGLRIPGGVRALWVAVVSVRGDAENGCTGVRGMHVRAGSRGGDVADCGVVDCRTVRD